MSIHIVWSGIFAVLVTPFREDLSLDENALARQVEFCLACGVQGVVAPVVASEFFTLSDSERTRIIEIVVYGVGDKIPFVAGVAGTSTAHAVELAKAAERAGASALIAMPPYTNRPTREGVIDYYRHLGTATALPVMVQNAGPPVGTPLASRDLAQLTREVPSIKAVKEESHPNPQQVGRLVAACQGQDVAVFGGLGGIYLFNEFSRGVRGSMPACQFADVAVDIFQLAAAGDLVEARRRFNALQPALVMERLYEMTFMKECLVRRGVLNNSLTRLPESRMDELDQRELDKVWEAIEPLFRYRGTAPASV